MTTIAGLDFAEETTLAAIEVLLTTISGLDFAEETTQAANEVLLTTIAGLDLPSKRPLQRSMSGRCYRCSRGRCWGGREPSRQTQTFNRGSWR